MTITLFCLELYAVFLQALPWLLYFLGVIKVSEDELSLELERLLNKSELSGYTIGAVLSTAWFSVMYDEMQAREAFCMVADELMGDTKTAKED